jgi:hypothetical protein
MASSSLDRRHERPDAERLCGLVEFIDDDVRSQKPTSLSVSVPVFSEPCLVKAGAMAIAPARQPTAEPRST